MTKEEKRIIVMNYLRNKGTGWLVSLINSLMSAEDIQHFHDENKEELAPYFPEV